jgi:hypothetical protein
MLTKLLKQRHGPIPKTSPGCYPEGVPVEFRVPLFLT